MPSIFLGFLARGVLVDRWLLEGKGSVGICRNVVFRAVGRSYHSVLRNAVFDISEVMSTTKVG